MNLETKITIYKFTPQLFTLTLNSEFVSFLKEGDWIYSCEHLCACRTLWRKGQTLRKQYKEKISDYRNRDQLEHAHDYLLYPENIGENLSLDETCLSNGDVCTILTNKAAKFSDWAISTEPLQRFAKVKKTTSNFHCLPFSVGMRRLERPTPTSRT